MQTEYTFHTDPGHGWIEVSRDEIERLGIGWEVSGYSYQRGDKVYLEEDADALCFLKAKHTLGEEVNRIEDHKENTPIRSYDSYSPLHPKKSGE